MPTAWHHRAIPARALRETKRIAPGFAEEAKRERVQRFATRHSRFIRIQ